MSANTHIAWAHDTFNPWEGCQKVGPGCDHCYAEARDARYHGGTAPHWGPHAERRLTSAANWNKPEKWDREAAASGQPRRVFCASLADVFDNQAPQGARARLGKLIKATPHLTWMLLTKRIGNAHACLDEMFPVGDVPSNVWIGMTVVNQAEAFRDRHRLKSVKAMWGIRRVFLSIEPMLGSIDLKGYEGWLDWVIVGGESGRFARPMHPEWVRKVQAFCDFWGIAFFFKQWGEWSPAWGRGDHLLDINGVLIKGTHDDPRAWKQKTHQPMYRPGKAVAGDQLDGVRHHNWPEAA